MTPEEALDLYQAETSELALDWGSSSRGQLAPKAFNALIAVLKLHQPNPDTCDECGLWDFHPCNTVKAIMAALEEPDEEDPQHAEIFNYRRTSGLIKCICGWHHPTTGITVEELESLWDEHKHEQETQ